MEVVELLAHELKAVVVADVLTVEGVLRGRIARRLHGASAGAQDHGLGGDGDEGAALHMHGHAASDRAGLVGRDVDQHGVLDDGDAAVLQDGQPLVLAHLLQVGHAIAARVPGVPVAGLRGGGVGLHKAEVGVLLHDHGGLVKPEVEVVEVGAVLAGFLHGEVAALAVVEIGEEVGSALREGGQAREARAALVEDDDVGAGVVGGQRRVQAGPAAPDHEHVALVGGLLGRGDLGQVVVLDEHALAQRGGGVLGIGGRDVGID